MTDMDDGFDDGQEPEEPQVERAPLCEEEENLNRVGVRMHFEDIWEGEPPNRHSHPDPNSIRTLLLPFTPDDWWAMTTRDGDDYIGPCCGTTGAMQDIMNGVYREGGWIDGHELLQLGGMGESHQDGFEDWGSPLKGDDLIKVLASWTTLSRWDRIGAIYRVTRDKLKTSSTYQEIRTNRSEVNEKDVIWILRNGLTFLSWKDLFERNKEQEQQDHANRLLLLARVLPAMKTLMGTFQNYQPFEGLAIVTKEHPDHVLDNHHGSCVYKTATEAEKIIELSKKATRDGDEIPTFFLRPVRVSVEQGLQFTDK